MAIDYSNDLYLLAWDQFARPVTVTPIVSQPGAPAYDNRGYFDTEKIDVLTEDGTVFSDHKTYLDIRLAEFPIVPLQGDLIDIPPVYDVPGGSFEVLDRAGVGNAGGMLTLMLRDLVTAKP